MGWLLSVNPGSWLKFDALGRLLICVQILCASANISILYQKMRKHHSFIIDDY